MKRRIYVSNDSYNEITIQLGSFVKNKYADMVLLDKNPLLVNPDEIKNINVLQTFVAGKSIFFKK